MNVNGFSRTINEMINQRLLDTHTNYLGKIISLKFNKATIQPLSMYKAYGAKAQKQSIITDIPILYPYKMVYVVDKVTEELIKMEQITINTGDVVLCSVCERDITEAKKGDINVPTAGRHHNLSDSILIMGLSSIEYI